MKKIGIIFLSPNGCVHNESCPRDIKVLVPKPGRIGALGHDHALVPSLPCPNL